MRMVFDPMAIGLRISKMMGVEALVYCPYHDDAHPSAEFNVQTGLFYCFSCGAKASARALAEKLGGSVVEVEEDMVVRHSPEEEWKKLLTLPSATDHPYLRRRGVTDEQVVRHGIRGTRTTIVFPLRDFRTDKVTGVQVRNLAVKPKYKIHGVRPPVLVLGDHPPSGSEVFVTEGVFGILAAERAGYTAVSTIGCNGTRDTAEVLSMWRPVICFDDDFPGYVGAGKLLLRIGHVWVMLPGGEWDEMGPDEWRERVEHGVRSRSQEEIARHAGDLRRYLDNVMTAKRKMEGHHAR